MNLIAKGFHRFNWTLTFLANHQPESIGGQAVIEGVLMRSPRRLAVAVRAPSGEIVVDNKEFLAYSRRHKLLGLPVIRGAASLIESLAIGIKALNFSMAVQEKGLSDKSASDATATNAVTVDGETPNVKAPSLSNDKPKKAEGLLIGLSLASSLLMALGLFQLLPYWVAGMLVGGDKHAPQDPVLFNLAAGAVRITLLLGYMWGISFLKDIGRVFQYHGAEHKSIFAHEKNGTMSIDGARAQSRFHPRCGTSFILIVALVCILFFSVFDAALQQWAHFTYANALQRFAFHLPMVPLVAGLSFEVLKMTAKFQDSPWVRPFILPGLWLQKITTREPDEKQLEVAIASIEAALA